MRNISARKPFLLPIITMILMFSDVFPGRAQFIDVQIELSPCGSVQRTDDPESDDPDFRIITRNSSMTWFKIKLPANVTAGIIISPQHHAVQIPVTCFTSDTNQHISEPQPVYDETIFFHGPGIPERTYTGTAKLQTTGIWIGIPTEIPAEVTIIYI